MKDIVVIYHDQCKDGFGSAYAAWKKFADTASYLPLKAQADLTQGLVDKEIYILDYSFDKETLAALCATNKKVVVIDHHASAQAVVTAFPANIFDLAHSGAVLSWQYFHPSQAVPQLLLYIEDHDLWKFALPHNQEINAALRSEPSTFTRFDELAELLEQPEFFQQFVTTGAIIADLAEKHVTELLSFRERVLFEGVEVWALNTDRTYRSILGHRLAKLNEATGGVPLGIVYYRTLGAVHISLRSEGDVDVAEIATKYGGGGHQHAASIRVPDWLSLPFTYL